MAPNKNQSSGWGEWGSGRQRNSWLAGIRTARTNSLTHSLFLSSLHTCSTIIPVCIGHERVSFLLTKNQRLCLPTWLLEAHEGRRSTLIKYGLLANWMDANVFKPLNHMLPGDFRRRLQGHTSLCSISHYCLIPGSLDIAPKRPDGTFIIDSDLSLSLPTSDSILVCVHIQLQRASPLQCKF